MVTCFDYDGYIILKKSERSLMPNATFSNFYCVTVLFKKK